MMVPKLAKPVTVHVPPGDVLELLAQIDTAAAPPEIPVVATLVALLHHLMLQLPCAVGAGARIRCRSPIVREKVMGLLSE